MPLAAMFDLRIEVPEVWCVMTPCMATPAFALPTCLIVDCCVVLTASLLVMRSLMVCCCFSESYRVEETMEAE